MIRGDGSISWLSGKHYAWRLTDGRFAATRATDEEVATAEKAPA